ncbi:hypothetical protein J6590_016233 [Homalodisca vitripennis]|nr:hypothetical protein J6590_016233 [Homalodisca vitripennis]
MNFYTINRYPASTQNLLLPGSRQDLVKQQSLLPVFRSISGGEEGHKPPSTEDLVKQQSLLAVFRSISGREEGHKPPSTEV